MARLIGLVNANDPAALQNTQFWLIAIPVFIAFVAILFIGAWIGWTMATTPPPKPIEEITTEIEDKKEEPKVEQAAASEAATTEEKTKEKEINFLFQFFNSFLLIFFIILLTPLVCLSEMILSFSHLPKHTLNYVLAYKAVFRNLFFLTSLT